MSAPAAPSSSPVSATSNPNRQSNSMASTTSSVAPQHSAMGGNTGSTASLVPAKPLKKVRVSPAGSFAVPISVDSQDDNRRVTFANDAYRSETPCTACCRSCMRCCRWLSRCDCCCPRRSEVTKYVDENGDAVPEDDDDYGYGAEASFYDFDNDPRERDTSSALRKCCRKEFIGIKLRHWCYLLCLLAVAAFLSFYLWWFFSRQSESEMFKRISHMCADRVALSGIGAHGSLKLLTICAEMVSNEYPSLVNISAADQRVLAHRLRHEQVNWFGSASWFGSPPEEVGEESAFIAGVTVAAIVIGPTARAAYEATHGPIWTFSLADANSGGSGLVLASVQDWYAPAVTSQGMALGASLDLASVPYFNATLSRMIATARTQLGEPFYVANYSAPVDADGGVTRGTLPGAPLEGPLSDNSGHRIFSFTPIHGHSFNFSTPGADPFAPVDFTDPVSGAVSLPGLRGVILACFNLVPFLHETHKVTSSTVDVLMTVWSSGAAGAPRKLLYNAYQISSVEEHQPFYDERPFSAVLNPASLALPSPSVDESPHYVDASTPSVAWQSLESSMSTMNDWGAQNFYDGMGFVSRCTPTRSYVDSNMDKSSLAIGGLTSAAFFLIIFFIFVQLRYLTAKEREVRFKNRVLTELQTEREKADSARDQKTDFMAFLCHELRNPLHAVLSMSDSLQETELDAEQQESVFTIHASSELMLAITNDILDLSKIEAGKIELESIPMDVSALVNSLVRGTCSWAAEKGVSVVGKIDPAIGAYNFVYADPTRLNQLLMNLISNAIKFTGKNGTVTLEVSLDMTHSTAAHPAPVLFDKPPSLPSHHSVTISSDQQQPSQQQTANVTSAVTPLVPLATLTTPAGVDLTPPPLPAGPAPVSRGQSQIRPQADRLHHRHSLSFGHAEAVELQHHPSPYLPAIPTPVQTPSPIIRPDQSSQPTPPLLGSRQASANGSPSVDVPAASMRHIVPRYPSSQTKQIFLPALGGGGGGGVGGVSPPTPSATESPLEHIAHARQVLTECADSTSGASPRSDNRRRVAADDTLGMLNTPGNRTLSSRVKSGVFISTDQPLTPPAAGTPGITSSLRIRRERLTWNRLSPASSPLISHAPAALQATLPQLLLNRHRRTDSASASPRLFGPAHPPHGPGSSRDYASNMSPHLSSEAAQHFPPPLPPRSMPGGHAPLARTLTSSSRAGQGPVVNTAAELFGVPSTHSPTHNNEKSTTTAPAGNSRKTAVSILSDEAEEFSRTAGQLGSARLIFRVQDTGIGIPSEFMGALFEPYSQAKRSITRSHGGTGLGLAIVKRLSDLMAGELMVESTIGQGTTFSFSADFLLARPPTPAMASMLRHLLPAAASTEIGQVRYSNYNGLKMAAEQPSSTDSNYSPQPPLPPMEPQLPPEFTVFSRFTMPPAALQLPLVADALYDNEGAAVVQPPPLLPLKRELSTIPSAPSSTRQTRTFNWGAADLLTEQSAGGSTAEGADTHARTPSMGDVLPSATPQAQVPSPSAISPQSSDSSQLLSPTSVTSAAARPDDKGWVLIVDDAQINRKILLKMLQNEWQVDQAENGLEAVNLVDANPSKYSCVLMDLMMPVMSGSDALQQMRSRGHTDLPVIAVTANTMAEDITKCVSIGFTSFLSKPCRKELVRSMVKQYARTPQQAAVTSSSSGGGATSKRTLAASPVLITSSTNGQIVASLSPLPPSAVGPTPTPTRFSISTGDSANQPSQSPVLRPKNNAAKTAAASNVNTAVEGEAER